MKSTGKINFALAYAAYDGKMRGCSGGECPTPCCNDKVVWGEGGFRTFNTVFETGEAGFQQKTWGDLPAGVRVETRDIGTDRMQIAHLVSGCLAPDGSCRMEGRKPLRCRVFPFGTSEFLPLREGRCPQAKVIAGDKESVAGIVGIREALGMDDHEGWMRNLLRARGAESK